MEKAVDAEVKVNLQLPFGTKKINSRCLKNYRPSVKKDNDNANWEHHDKTLKNKAKSYNSFSANQSQIRSPRKTSTEAIKEIIQLLKSMSLRKQKRIRIKSNT